MTSTPAVKNASTVISNITSPETAAFTPEQEAQILGPAAINDKRYGSPPATSADFIKQVAIVSNCAVLGHTGAPVRARDSAMLTVYGGYTPNWNFAKPRRLKERVFRNGLVTSVKGRHYYHFIEHMLPVLNYLRQEHKPGTPLTVLVPGNGNAFQHEICAAVSAGFPDVSFVPLETDEKAIIDEYLWLHDASGMAEWLPVNQEGAAAFTQLMLRHYGLDDAPLGGQRLFFSRGKAKQRRLHNEAELETIASTRGFERFEAHSGNHKSRSASSLMLM
ncbi:MAG: glycosyltransferase 61 family protein [Alphaproteobacteria bacterium]